MYAPCIHLTSPPTLLSANPTGKIRDAMARNTAARKAVHRAYTRFFEREADRMLNTTAASKMKSPMKTIPAVACQYPETDEAVPHFCTRCPPQSISVHDDSRPSCDWPVQCKRHKVWPVQSNVHTLEGGDYPCRRSQSNENENASSQEARGCRDDYEPRLAHRARNGLCVCEKMLT